MVTDNRACCPDESYARTLWRVTPDIVHRPGYRYSSLRKSSSLIDTLLLFRNLLSPISLMKSMNVFDQMLCSHGWLKLIRQPSIDDCGKRDPSPVLPLALDFQGAFFADYF